MAISTFLERKLSRDFQFQNTWGIPDEIFTAIVKQAQKQIDRSLEPIQEQVDNLFGGHGLTDGANINTDASLAVNYYVTLGGNRTMVTPTNWSEWKIIRYLITQDGTGSRTLTWDSGFRFSASIPSPTLTTTPDFSDYIEFIYNPTYSTWDCIRFVGGFDSTPV